MYYGLLGLWWLLSLLLGCLEWWDNVRNFKKKIKESEGGNNIRGADGQDIQEDFWTIGAGHLRWRLSTKC